jgi:hypothetical protein
MSKVYKAVILVLCMVSLVIGCGTSKKAEKAKEEAGKVAAEKVTKEEKGSEKEAVEIDKVVERKWEEHGRVRIGIVYYYEKDSITYPSRGMIRVWRKRVLPDRMADKEIISLDEVDCQKEKFRSVFVQVLRKNDTIDTFKKPSEDWAQVFADSPEEYFMDHFCKEANKAR